MRECAQFERLQIKIFKGGDDAIPTNAAPSSRSFGLSIAAGRADTPYMQGSSSSNQAAAWRTARTWCYLNFAEDAVADAAWWTNQLRRSSVQGVVLPLGDGPEGLGRLAALAQAARAAGLAVLASAPVRPLTREAFASNPAWVARNDKGEPIAVKGGYAACVNGGYFDAPTADRIAQAVTQVPVEGVVGVGWSGLGWDKVCYCPACQSALQP